MGTQTAFHAPPVSQDGQPRSRRVLITPRPWATPTRRRPATDRGGRIGIGTWAAATRARSSAARMSSTSPVCDVKFGMRDAAKGA